MISRHVLIAVSRDFLAGHGSDDVTLTEAGHGRGRTFQGTTHEHAPDFLDGERAQQGLHFNASPPTNDAPLLNELRDDGFGRVGRNGPTEATDADFIDAGNPSIGVDQGAAGIAAEDDRIVAEPAHQFADGFTIEAHPADETRHDHGVVGDDPERDGLGQAGGATHRKHRIAYADSVRIRKLRDGQRRLRPTTAEV